MNSVSNHQLFYSPSRASQSLCNDRCQNILYKAVFEHFKELKWIAALLLASKSFQNSSFGANFVVNYVVDNFSIFLFESVLSPSSCFSMQFVPSLHISHPIRSSKKVNDRISNFVEQLGMTKYLPLSLRFLTLDSVSSEIVYCFFGSSPSNSWPKLQDLSLENCTLDDSVLEVVSKNALQLRTLNLARNQKITDFGLEQSLSRLSGITSLNLSECAKITHDGLEHLSNLSNIKSLNLSSCSKITDTGLQFISHLSCLSFLDLSDCNLITDVGLEFISTLPGITFLNLCRCDKVSDAGVEHLSKNLSNITSLSLYCCVKITDIGIEHLSTLPRITGLILDGCHNITMEARIQFEKKNANCNIIG